MRKSLQLFTDVSVSLLSSNEAIYGIRKLAQRFIYELFTEEGSIIYYPTRGCNFVRNCKRAATEWDIQAAFAAAMVKIKRAFKTIDKNLPAYDRFKDAKLDRILLEEDTLHLILTISNKMGASVQVDTPYIYLDEG